MTFKCEWRGDFDNAALNALHAEGFGYPVAQTDWREQLERYSLGWVCAREDGSLIGFVNVAWDGGVHAFILDTVVAQHHRSRGVGSALVATAAHEARAAKCEWLHVDFEEHLRSFYFDACGFQETPAGLIALSRRGPNAGPPSVSLASPQNQLGVTDCDCTTQFGPEPES